MQRLEQEVKELQAGLGAVVQALNFLQTFIESDYGMHNFSGHLQPKPT